MAIFSHEGLPRSGKSYESAVYVILPALKKGRKVWAYVDCLNHEMFAELAGISLEKCKELLISIPEEDVLKIPQRCYDENWKDGWVVIDEIQDFYPSGYAKLNPITSKFISRHGHEGLDILLMGQSMSDIHSMWLNRMQQKTQFFKRDMIGQENSYTWTSFRVKQDAKGKPQFLKIKSGKRKYESKYFGLYASHSADTENTDNHQDDRANVFKSKMFTTVIPLFLLVLVFAFFQIKSFFTEPPTKQPKNIQSKSLKSEFNNLEKKPSLKQNEQLKSFKNKELDSLKKKNQKLKDEIEKLKNPVEYVNNLISSTRPRLLSLIHTDKKTIGYVEFLDSSFRAKERLSLKQLKALGWSYEIKEDFLVLTKDTDYHIVTTWPIEPTGKTSTHQNNNLGQSNNQVYKRNSVNVKNRHARYASIKDHRYRRFTE